eukprot:TRINITY_DN99231_c0_g1_i1.p2 TRINITY_DN99231_c0_g1~~TRINITY_DN99231_c0_g1_i1.p2  ORF type:complete len:138 (-),score=16.46 TRINITY_DN99231_c0_g1_i1:7-360(-)
MSHQQIVDALADARFRGVDSRLMLDARERHRQSAVENLGQVRWVGEEHWGEGTRIHAKVLIVDALNPLGTPTCITGSGNPSRFSERSIEDCIILSELAVVRHKAKQFDALWRTIAHE